MKITCASQELREAAGSEGNSPSQQSPAALTTAALAWSVKHCCLVKQFCEGFYEG